MEKNTAIMSDDEFYEHRKKILKETLTLDDCLSCEETSNILYSEHLWEFERKCLPKIEDLYDRTRAEMHGKHATPLYYDIHDEFSGHLGMIVYKNIKKDYDLSLFYECPDLANPLLDNTTKMLRQTTNRCVQQPNKVIEKSDVKKFDWATKTYK